MCSARVTNFKIETLRGCTPTNIFNSLREVFGEGTMNRSNISRWAAKFKKNQKSTEDAPHSGRLRTFTDATNASVIAPIIDEDRRLTLQEIVTEANALKMSAQCIMKDLLQKKVCAW